MQLEETWRTLWSPGRIANFLKDFLRIPEVCMQQLNTQIILNETIQDKTIMMRQL